MGMDRLVSVVLVSLDDTGYMQKEASQVLKV